jgi:hypothetical protein
MLAGRAIEARPDITNSKVLPESWGGDTSPSARHARAERRRPVAPARTLQSWEIGRRSPQPLSAAALARFLEEHPSVSIGRGKPRD